MRNAETRRAVALLNERIAGRAVSLRERVELYYAALEQARAELRR